MSSPFRVERRTPDNNPDSHAGAQGCWQHGSVTTALLLENPHIFADQIFEDNGIEVRRLEQSLDEDELIEALQGVTILGIRSATKVTERVLRESPSLRAIGAYCIGTNQIDVDAAAEQGVTVFNAPYSNTRSVVELAMAEIIIMGRRLFERSERLHQGVWEKTAVHAHEIRGRTLGIIGYGSIGTQLSVLAEAMGMRVIFYDIAERLALGNAERKASMEEVLREADVVSLHVSGDPQNTNLFGEEEFAMMKPRALFLNLSRGFIVDVDALRRHLLSGHLAGASVDVFPTEPKKNVTDFVSPLQGLQNVIITPHIGGSTIEAQENIARFVSNKVVDYLRDGGTYMSVNLPNLALPVNNRAAYRLCLIHRNIPGVMAALNEVFARQEVNVVSQVLATQGDIGYALTDVAGPMLDESLKEIQDFDSTIRLRYFPI